MPTECTLQSLDGGKRLRLYFCPPKVLQGHNLFGVDDIRTLISKCVPRILKLAQITATPYEVQRIREGKVTLNEVHIAYNFRLPAGAIRPLIEQTIRAAPQQWKIQRLKRGIGFTIFAGSRSRYFIVYDKGLEFVETGKRYFTDRLVNARGFDKARWYLRRRRLLKYAVNTLRVELRLLYRYLRVPSRSLYRADAWTLERPHELFFLETKNLKFPRSVRINRVESIIHRAPRNLKGALIAWQAGHDPRDSLSTRSYYRHRNEIRRLFKIDIARPLFNSQDTSAVTWRGILRPEGILDAPDWAAGHTTS
jgi:hypothetical protein